TGFLIGGSSSVTSLGKTADGHLDGATRLMVFAGTNDLKNSYTAQKTFAAYQAWLAARIAAGWSYDQIWVLTTLPRGQSTQPADFEKQRQAYISLIVADGAAKGYHVVRLDTNKLIGVPGAYRNRTYYNSDRVHPTAAGHVVIANVVKATSGW